ncbi:hypothetical protein COCCADRAFT_111845 [Bipolaris zeicola 26-R-13]|uniref:Uncharacterized protein n=1 Tax=Cochliobolus carbonum (strain 26-R-13) TaxID=930089 RepID=W6Y8G3_COCC2|nr:uncharacterized protein COCCADRAFT_111845 [Bipolaris zeicola 26-R-13]EUC27386.1 hypothetical protein COCCADRAFT_111845 [Bipolaris zeicola 26-R-13]
MSKVVESPDSDKNGTKIMGRQSKNKNNVVHKRIGCPSESVAPHQRVNVDTTSHYVSTTQLLINLF